MSYQCYDSIPIESTIECVEEKPNLFHNLTKMSKNEILIAIRTVFNNTVFLSTKITLSPIIANIVLEDTEARIFKKLKFKPIIYTQYVEDIFTIIPTDKIQEFVDVFNSVEDSIKFTSEIEIDRILNYLDLSLIKDENGNIRTTWYKKPIFSGQYLNYNSHHPFAQKIGCAKNLIDRGIKLSDVQFRKENLNQIREVLILNSYPLPLINSLIKERINDIYNSSIKNKRKKK